MIQQTPHVKVFQMFEAWNLDSLVTIGLESSYDCKFSG
jgi:hypothetical protein